MSDFYFNTAIIGTVIGVGSTLWYFYEQHLVKERKEREEAIRNLANSIKFNQTYDYRLGVIRDLVDRDFTLLLTYLNDNEIQDLRRIKREYEEQLRREAEIRIREERERMLAEQERRRQERERRLQEIARRYDYNELNNLSSTDFQDVLTFFEDQTQIALARARRDNYEAEKRLRHETERLRIETERLQNNLRTNIIIGSINTCNNEYTRGFSKGVEDGSDIGNLNFKNKNRSPNFFMTDQYREGYDHGYQKGYNQLNMNSQNPSLSKVVYYTPTPPVCPAPINLSEIRKEIKQEFKEVKEEIRKTEEARKEKEEVCKAPNSLISEEMMYVKACEEDDQEETDTVKKQLDVLSMLMN